MCEQRAHVNTFVEAQLIDRAELARALVQGCDDDDDEFYSLLGARGDSYDLLLKLLNSSQCLCEKLPWSAIRGTSQATQAVSLQLHLQGFHVMSYISVLKSNHELHDTPQYSLLSIPGPS